MRAGAIAVAALALALSARAHAAEPAGSAPGSGQAAGQESAGGASTAQPGEQGTGSAGAQQEPGATEKDPAARAREAPQTQSVVGTVEKLEADSLTVKSSPLSDPHEVKLGADTKFLRDGETISRDQIAEGDQIRASFAGEGPSGTATEISVIKKGEGSGAKAAPGSSSSGTR